MMASQLVGRNRPSAATVKPAGVCIQEFTDKIQNALSSVPNATRQLAAKCNRGPTLLMPNSMTPRNPASRKNAVSTS